MLLKRGVSFQIFLFSLVLFSGVIVPEVEGFRSTSFVSLTKISSLPQAAKKSNLLLPLPILSMVPIPRKREHTMSKLYLNERANNESSSTFSIWDGVVTKIGSTTSMLVAGSFFLALCYKRDALMVAFFVGAIGNAVFGKLLKKLLNIERPDAGSISLLSPIDRPSDNGMPSSHAMSLGFICTFVALLVPIAAPGLLAYASISLVYRIRTKLHTLDQILVGAVLGSLDGSLWWHLCTNGVGGASVVELVSSSGIMNEKGLLPWYLLAIPALIGAAVVGSVERRLARYFGKTAKEE